jgi:Skp family chaperone for outer membrane proteins
MLCHIGKLVLITIACAVLAHAQSKVAFIDSNAFLDEKGGITKFVGAFRILNEGFKPDQVEIDTLNTKLEALKKELADLEKLQVADRSAIVAKYEQGEKLQRDIKFKSEDAKARYERRQQTQLGPIQQAIMKGLQDYAKEKGYTLIFDIAKDQNGLLIAIGDQSADVTKDFIAYYNAKP